MVAGPTVVRLGRGSAGIGHALVKDLQPRTPEHGARRHHIDATIGRLAPLLVTAKKGGLPRRRQQKTPLLAGFVVLQMAERTGLEPATSGVTGQHSNQLNYRSTLSNCIAMLNLVGAEGFEPPTLSV